MRRIDQTTWFLLRRVAAVAAFLPVQEKLPPPPSVPQPAPLDEAIATLGHQVRFGHGRPSEHNLLTAPPAGAGKRGGGRFHCAVCGFTWTRARRRALVAMGPCPGSYVWTTTIPWSLELPWQYPRSTELMWKGHSIHITHRLTFYRGVIFCTTCGARSAKGAPQALRSPCGLKPMSPSTAYRLKCMKEGRWPPGDPPGDWPEAIHMQCPNGLVYWMD